MTKRLLDFVASDFEKASPQQLLRAIQASDGRIVLSENDVTRGPAVKGITNAELARSAGADMILMNKLDLFDIQIPCIDVEDDPIRHLRKLVQRPVGVNLEPAFNRNEELELVDLISLPSGRLATKETLIRAQELGFDFVSLTGNPSTGVSHENLVEATRLAKKHFGGIIMVGKMHRAGLREDVINQQMVVDFIEAGADVIYIPAVGSISGFSAEEAHELTRIIQEAGKLAMAIIGTSQDNSRRETVQQLGLNNRIAGVDIHHIGSSGSGGVALYENIFELSVTVRGLAHTLRLIASSANR